MLAEIVWNERMVAIAGLFGFLAVGAIGYYWANGIRVRSTNELKQSMVERGMSAAEIERVMNAGNVQEANI